jgi:hypothetical protein
MDKHWRVLKNISVCTTIFVVGLLVLVGCRNQQINNTTINQELEIKATRTSRESAIREPEPSPTLARTVIAIPNMAVTTKTLQPAFTKTPFPTQNPEDAWARVTKLLDDNAGCQFPCWWGIEPGKTSWEDALLFLAPFAQKNQMSPVGWFQFAVPGVENTLQQQYTTQDGRIIMVEIHFGNIRAYTLNDLLSTYGQPADVRIRTFGTEHQGNVPFYLLLFYPEKGILARYDNVDAEIVGNKVRKCFREENLRDLALWSPEMVLDFEQATQQTVNIKFRDGFPLLSLEEATGMDLPTFYEKFQDPTSSCLETPANLWPGQFQ